MKSPRVRAVLLALAGLLLAAAAPAQEPLDSLAARLQRAEDAIERLQRQIEEQAQAKVQSRLRNRVEISGLILANGFYNSAKVNNSDVPQFATLLAPADTAGGLPTSHLAGQLRQTRLGITVSEVRVLRGTMTGDLQLDFYGGRLATRNGNTHPLPRIRTATIRLDWPHIGLMVGQESPTVSPLNPVSLASSGFPLFATSGNLWLWLPQARLALEAGTRFRFGLQAAALAPLSPDSELTTVTAQPDRAERSGRPVLQGRLYVGWGADDTESQLGFGIHRGWLAFADSTVASEAYTVDGRLALGSRILIQGEAFFQGQALAGLGGGGIAQNFTPGPAGAVIPVRSQGGWAQLVLRPSFAWELGGGYGLDDPDDDDVNQATGRGRNVAIQAFLHWRPGGGLLFGAEGRRIETTYPAGVLTANHLNAFVGLAF